MCARRFLVPERAPLHLLCPWGLPDLRIPRSLQCRGPLCGAAHLGGQFTCTPCGPGVSRDTARAGNPYSGSAQMYPSQAQQVSCPKRRQSSSQCGGTKWDRKAISVQVKLEVLWHFEAGEKLSRIGHALGLSTSTVATIHDNRDKIRMSSRAATPQAATRLTHRRSLVMESMEQQLSVWIEDQNKCNVPINVVLIQEKARSLFEDLKREQDEGAQSETFGASCRWFARFKARHSLHSLWASGEAPGASAEQTQKDRVLLRRVIQEGGSTAWQVFDVGKTGLFWKPLPNRMFLPTEDKSAPGFKAARDLLTLLLSGNAAGDFKLKPLLVNPSENPCALKGFSKPSLPVLWRSHKKAWVTTSLFQEWFVHFCPAVERYCAQHGLPHRALLILDGAPGHPGNLDDLSDRMRVEHLPKNSTALLQPTNWDVVATFAAHYLRRVFRLLAARAGGACEPSRSRPCARTAASWMRCATSPRRGRRSCPPR
ncbi:tigger transposable element-derived protein 1-like [Pteropus medius]|uniref:tigger transposable element-derived protein 1-like n=1 Tax=Pteropus vampyrus TaxID=132908 RepID=UPI00196A2B30|nr:tigger transposable element-derived protein 1-like [Pteropus giganteus]